MPKFRTRSFEVMAEQFFAHKLPWPKGVTFNAGDQRFYVYEPAGDPVRITDDDWVITDTDGARRVCGPITFEKMYDPVYDLMVD